MSVETEFHARWLHGDEDWDFRALVPYTEWKHVAHSVLGIASGIAITVAFAWQANRRPSPARRAVAALLAVLRFTRPLAMLAFPGMQGVIQRIMYALVFAWLWL